MRTLTIRERLVVVAILAAGVGATWLDGRQVNNRPGSVGAGAPSTQIVSIAAHTSGSTTLSAGGNEYSNRFRVNLDTENSTQIAVTAYQSGSCGGTPGTWIVQYSLDGTVWFDAGVTPVSCTGGGQKNTAYSALAPGARLQAVWYRVFYTDGTTGSPALSTIFLKFR